MKGLVKRFVKWMLKQDPHSFWYRLGRFLSPDGWAD